MTDRIRRNGQLSACEPCRKSKLRCDHRRPVCGRCARRRLSEQQCHYHPAPMARQLTPQSNRETPHQQEAARSITTGSSPYELINMNGNLMSFADSNTPHRSYTSLTRTSVALPQPSSPNQEIISQGASLLNDVLELVTEIGESFERFSIFETDLCIQGPLVKVAWNATNNSIRSLLSDRPTLNLESISREIFERTSTHLIFPPTAAGGALESAFSTQALRWETIGIYCAQIGIYLSGEKYKSFSPLANETWKTDRKELMRRAFQACIQCESFCDHLGAINDLTLWFLMVTIVFATWCFGDDSYHALRLVGSMSSVFLALGFHKGVPHDPSMPFYMTEIRKRAIAWAHDHDKVCASFTSRPVHLSRHFCEIEMPLDLPDSAIMGTPEMFRKACENLDADGWGKDRTGRLVSGQRVQLMLCMIREEALELKLGPPVPDIEANAERTLRKLKSTWESIPSHMKNDTVKQWTGQPKTAMMLQCLRLDYLYTEFILHTLLASTSGISREKLLSTAHEIIHTVLLPTRMRDLLHSHRADMEWALVFYAIPCASVLILELLRKNQHSAEQLTINRSGIIQDISILISCCDSWTESGQSNYQICKQAQSIFSKSLDSILNQTESIQRNKSEEPTASQNEHHHGFMDLSPEMSNVVAHDPDWMALLDSLGLQGDLWLESSIPPLEFP